MFALIYTVLYAAFSLEIVGTEGKGSLVFFAPLITWVLVIAATFLLSEDISRFRRIFAAVLLGVHYVVAVLSVVNYFVQDDGHFAHSWERSPYAVIFAITWYITGQLILWWILMRNASEPPSHLP